MAKCVLDTNVLIDHWRRCRGKRPIAEFTVRSVVDWAGELIELRGTDAIVTPIWIEFIARGRGEHEINLSLAFLGEFEIVDEGKITDEDWQEAARLAKRVPRSGKPRQLGDCLIRAICKRLRLEVWGYDQGFPR